MSPEIWEARLSKARPLFEQGMSRVEVAKALSISPRTAATYADILGVSPDDIRIENRLGEIKQLAEQGKTRSEAASLLGVCYSSIVTLSVKHGIAFRHASAGVDDEERADTMATMFRSGRTLQQIGEVFGVTRERVRQIIKKHAGIVGKDGGRIASAARSKEARDRRRDIKCLAKRGCTYQQYLELRKIGEQMKADGKGYYRRPIGAFTTQRNNAIQRGIGWSLTLWDWWQIWQQSGCWEKRGRGGALYVMCRYGDTGAYEAGNVYIATLRHNSKVQPNNRYRSSHPEHAEFIEQIAARKAQESATPSRIAA